MSQLCMVIIVEERMSGEQFSFSVHFTYMLMSSTYVWKITGEFEIMWKSGIM